MKNLPMPKEYQDKQRYEIKREIGLIRALNKPQSNIREELTILAYIEGFIVIVFTLIITSIILGG